MSTHTSSEQYTTGGQLDPMQKLAMHLLRHGRAEGDMPDGYLKPGYLDTNLFGQDSSLDLSQTDIYGLPLATEFEAYDLFQQELLERHMSQQETGHIIVADKGAVEEILEWHELLAQQDGVEHARLPVRVGAFYFDYSALVRMASNMDERSQIEYGSLDGMDLPEPHVAKYLPTIIEVFSQEEPPDSGEIPDSHFYARQYEPQIVPGQIDEAVGIHNCKISLATRITRGLGAFIEQISTPILHANAQPGMFLDNAGWSVYSYTGTTEPRWSCIDGEIDGVSSAFRSVHYESHLQLVVSGEIPANRRALVLPLSDGRNAEIILDPDHRYGKSSFLEVSEKMRIGRN